MSFFKNHSCFLPLIFIGVFLIPFGLNNDDYFLLKYGETVLAHGFPTTDPLSMHSDFDFVMPQWLYATMLYLAYSNFGLSGVTLSVFICAAITMFLLYNLFSLVSKNDYANIPLCFIIGFLMSSYFLPRPWMFSNLFLISTVYCLEKYAKTDNKKWLYCLPVISLLLINSHASVWIMMLVLSAPYIIERPFHKPYWWAATSVILAGLLSPYGYMAEIYGFLGLHPSPIIKEMSPLTVKSFTDLIFFATIVEAIVCISKIKMPLRYALLSIGTSIMFLMAFRNISFFFFFGLLPYIYALQNKKKNSDDTDKRNFCIAFLIFSLLVLTAAICFVIYAVCGMGQNITTLFASYSIFIMAFLFLYVLYGLVNILKAHAKKQTNIAVLAKVCSAATLLSACLTSSLFSYPLTVNHTAVSIPESYTAYDCMKWLQNNEPNHDVKIMTTYDLGSYVEYFGYKPYIDTRAEVFYENLNHKADIMDEYLAVKTGKIHYKDFLDKYNFDYVLTEKTSDIFDVYVSHDNDYELVSSSYTNNLFRRKNK